MAKTFPVPQDYAAEPRPQIALQLVESSQIKAIGYDPATKTLACQFAHGTGAIYHYPNVEPDVHAAFVFSESIGKFFGQHIKALPFSKYPPDLLPEVETHPNGAPKYSTTTFKDNGEPIMLDEHGKRSVFCDIAD